LVSPVFRNVQSEISFVNLANHGLSSFTPWMMWSKMKREYSKSRLQ
jgi:hypothetical protein